LRTSLTELGDTYFNQCILSFYFHIFAPTRGLSAFAEREAWSKSAGGLGRALN
jgi:hypothetical protein